ncbi:MAG TPA: response regulator transcription factor [Terriglobia bacterium]|nr:response regulator transcription factor [Terriglobia bacterium]
MTEEIRIVIADDHHFFRSGLRHGLQKASSLRLIAEASDGVTALEHIRSLRPDIAILDIGLPKMNGVAVVRRIREESIPVEIVFLTVCEDRDIFEEALELGVKGYLLKDCTEAELLRCITAVASGQHYTTPPMTTYLVDKVRGTREFSRQNPGIDLLTLQERAVFRRIADGKTSKEIAEDMGIAPKTVDAHRANICRKLEIHGPNVLGRFATQHRNQI